MRTEKNVPPERVPSEVIDGLNDAHARLELPLVEPHSAAAPADDAARSRSMTAVVLNKEFFFVMGKCAPSYNYLERGNRHFKFTMEQINH